MTSVASPTPLPNGDPSLLQKSRLADPQHGSTPLFYRLEEILIERCRSTPDVPMIGYPSTPHTAEDYTYYSARQFDRFVNGAIQDLQRQGLERAQTASSGDGDDAPVAALLGPATLDYVVTVFALARMGYAAFYLSTRLSQEAYMSLLDQTDCQRLIYADHVPALSKSVSELHAKRGDKLNSFTFTPFASYSQCAEPSEYRFKSKPSDGSRTAYIIHSSGSSGIPKAIPSIHAAGIANYTFARSFESYFLTLPFYHGHGVSMFFRAVFKGKPIGLYNASLPLTGPHLVRSLRATRPESLHCVPYALKLLAETDGGPEALAGPKQVLFGGSSCPDHLGDELVARGARIISHYGATEFGQVMTSDRPADDKAWNYLRPLPHAAPFLRFDQLGDDDRDDASGQETYECVVLDGLPSKNKSNSDQPPNSFRTSDKFVKHPRLPDRWKYVGRLDDRVNLVNGEKVLPIPIEHRVRRSRLVKEVLVVGVGRVMPGLLIMPSDEARGLDKNEIVDRVWPDVAAANENAEAFSQISRDMVEILPVDVAYPQTEKGTLIRKACYKQFADVIDALFARAEGSDAANDSQLPSSSKLALGVEGIQDFLLGVIQRDLGLDHVGPDSDFFTAGLDSLQTIKVYGIIKRSLDLGKGSLNQNALYDHGNIRRLAVHLHNLRTGEKQGEAEDEIEVMSELIKKYSDFQTPAVKNDQEVVLLTGATGSLGCYILSRLLSNPSVRRVYCLTRAPTSDAALDRVVATLTARQLPVANLSKIRALPSDFSRPDLGLHPDTLAEVKATLTKVVHSAWSVNFNIGVRSFEKHHIAGVRNLIDLCLACSSSSSSSEPSSRPGAAEFYFCSSISAAAGTPMPAVIEEGPVPELSSAFGMGYARSKLVAERIVQAAAEQTGMVSKVLRVGQIVGDTVHGRWNLDEGIPLMLRSAKTLGALPTLNESLSWTPVDVVARAVLELSSLETPDGDSAAAARKHAQDPKVVYHVLNPLVIDWTRDLLPALRDAGLEFEAVGQREWVQRLREGEQDPVKNPTVKLTEFYAQKYDNESNRSGLSYRTTYTEEASPALRGGVDLVSSGIIKKFVNFF